MNHRCIPQREKAVAQSISNFRVEERQQLVAAIDQGDIYAERHEDRSIFAANHAATDHRQTFGDAFHLQKSVGIKRMHVVESNFSGAIRLRAGGNQNDVAAQPANAVWRVHGDGVGIFECCLSAHQFDAVEFQILQNAPALHLDNCPFVMHEIVDGQIFFQ